jgi:butyrate kinase
MSNTFEVLDISEMLTHWIKERVGFISEVKLFPGEDEMQALAEGVYFGTMGEIPVKEYE